eukprot:scaffold184381_cov18-Tisochrysis_lutea.AAC.1
MELADDAFCLVAKIRFLSREQASLEPLGDEKKRGEKQTRKSMQAGKTPLEPPYVEKALVRAALASRWSLLSIASHPNVQLEATREVHQRAHGDAILEAHFLLLHLLP